MDDPLSALIWAVFCFAAGMYPLGILLPCSSCCNPSCPSPIEFNRCVRIEDPSASQLSTTFSSPTEITQPIHGWSFPVRKTTDIGVYRVATRYEVTGRVFVDNSASSLQEGQSSSATYTLCMRQSNGQPGRPVGEMRITVSGVASGSQNTAVTTVEDSSSTETYRIFFVSIPSTNSGSYVSMPTLKCLLTETDFLQSGFVCVKEQNQYLGGVFFGSFDYWRFYNGNAQADWEYDFDYVSARDLKFIMRPFIQRGWGLSQAAWNFNHDEVLSFLNGTPTDVTFNSYYDADYSYYLDDPSWPGELAAKKDGVVRRISISPPNQYCGVHLCDRTDTYMYSTIDLIPNTLTYKASKFPASWPEKANACAGSDTNLEVTLRRRVLGNLAGSCRYVGSIATCEGSNRWSVAQSFYTQYQDPVTTLAPVASVRWFYCGDFLWAIERGPCRQSVTISGDLLPGGGANLPTYQGEYSLGGDDGESYYGTRCAKGYPTGGADCPEAEAVITVPSGQVFHRTTVSAGAVGVGWCGQVGICDGGDVVCSLAFASCLLVQHDGSIPYRGIRNPAGTANLGDPWPDGSLAVRRTKRRDKWCVGWETHAGFYLTGAACMATGCWDPINNLSFGYPECIETQLPCETHGSTDVTATASPQTATVAASGGTVSVTWCCPETQQQYSVGPNVIRSQRLFSISRNGATVYVTQEGQGQSHCTFDMTWYYKQDGVAYSSLEPAVGGNVIFLRTDCPTYGSPKFSEQPPCDWSVSQSGDWFTAEKTPDGNLVRIIDTAGSGGSPYPGTITITAGTETQAWEVRRQ